jgi:hypothetical protein
MDNEEAPKNPKIKKKPMDKKHKDFLKVLKANAGLVMISCEKAGIHHSTYYDWKENIEGFDDEVYAINEAMLDMAEGKLYQNVQNNDNASIMFLLKCKAKHRGYIERQQVEHSGQIEIVIDDEKE